jgi:hypothetical protein
MYKTVFLYCLLFMQFCCHAAEQTPREKQPMPSLRWMAWQTIRSYVDDYAKIPDCFMPEVEQALYDFESLDEDPFLFLQLAHALDAEEQVECAARYIATWMHNITPGRPGGDVLQFAHLSEKIAALPDDLGTRVWDYRNKINDITGQFPEEVPSAAQAE